MIVHSYFPSKNGLSTTYKKTKEIVRRLTIWLKKKDLAGETGVQRCMEGGDFVF